MSSAQSRFLLSIANCRHDQPLPVEEQLSEGAAMNL